MGKGSKRQKKDSRNPRRADAHVDDPDENMDDEIDAFHKERDLVPLDVNGDDGVSDEDMEQPVFDFEDDIDPEDESQLTGLAAKIKRQEKALRLKFGGVEDEMQDDAEEEERKAVWGRNKHLYYGADNVDYEQQSSDEEDPEVEETEALRLRGEEMKLLTKEDYGLDEFDQDESDDTDSDGPEKLTQDALFGERSPKGNEVSDVCDDKAYEVVKRDLNSLSKEEQMEVVYSSAPELVNLLSELNDTHNQLEGEVKPLLSKVKEKNIANKEWIRFLETKQFLLVAYCQAIVFYLHLKSEGHPVRDHPVIARLVEIKNLLNKMKGIGGRFPSQAEETLNQGHGIEPGLKIFREGASLEIEPNYKRSLDLPKPCEVNQVNESREFINVGSAEDHEVKPVKHASHKNDPVSFESMEMLKVRARLEEKLKKNAVYSSIASKPNRTQNHVLKPMNRLLETLDDFDDEVMDTEPLPKAHTSAARPRKLSQLVAEAGKKSKKPKVISGDHDLPARDDIGERRRKYEIQVLGNLEPQPTELNDLGGGKAEGTEDEFYKEVKKQRAAKLAAKEEIYSRSSTVPLPKDKEREFTGRRKISYQMDKNKGLTRSRKKLTKIPRKKYKLKHEKAVVHRKGQVRGIRRPAGSYGGEASGINTNISRSIRF